jgi:hypothetical protein
MDNGPPVVLGYCRNVRGDALERLFRVSPRKEGSMAHLEAKDKVQWRAGDTPSSSHTRTGVIKEVLPGGLCLVSTKVDGAAVVEEIRMARLKPVELPAPAPKKRGRKPAAKKAAKDEAKAEKPVAAKKVGKRGAKAKKASRKKSRKKAA